jgi:metal-responsive CopG/Arc/MetJ family transcriptional regulator
MPTSVHLPAELLEAVDRRARALRISRNQLVVRALEREVQGGNDWSPGFRELLADVTPELESDVDALLKHVRSFSQEGQKVRRSEGLMARRAIRRATHQTAGGSANPSSRLLSF